MSGRTLTAVLALAAVCGAATPAPARAPWDDLALLPAPAGVRPPDFVLPDAEGRTVRLDDFRGRYVVLNFWASWCLACEMEMPAIERLFRRPPRPNLAVVGVNVRQSAELVRRFARERALTFPLLLDADGAVSARFRVWSLPFTVLLAPSGEVLAVAEGPRNWDSPEARRLLRGLGKLTPEASQRHTRTSSDKLP